MSRERGDDDGGGLLRAASRKSVPLIIPPLMGRRCTLELPWALQANFSRAPEGPSGDLQQELLVQKQIMLEYRYIDLSSHTDTPTRVCVCVYHRDIWALQ